jgi:hypothetical protein
MGFSKFEFRPIESFQNIVGICGLDSAEEASERHPVLDSAEEASERHPVLDRWSRTYAKLGAPFKLI